MKKNNKKTIDNNIINRIISIIIGIVITILIISNTITSVDETNNRFISSTNNNLYNELSVVLNNQKKVDKELSEILLDNTYTLDEPYIKINPYGMNPLSAVIIFNTETSVKITATINDKSTFTYEETTNHIIPVYWLYDNAVNTVTLTTSNGYASNIEIKTTALNDNLKDYELPTLKTDEYDFVYGNDNDKYTLRAFDYNGNLVFFYNKLSFNSIELQNKYFYIGYNGYKNDDENIKIELDYLGRVYSIDTNIDNLNKINNIDNDQFIDIIKKINNNEITFKFNDIVDNVIYNKYEIISSNELESKLYNARRYNKDYDIYAVGDYIINNISIYEDAKLILLPSDEKEAYIYDINNIIKIDNINNAAIYLKIGDNYYNLYKNYVK